VISRQWKSAKTGSKKLQRTVSLTRTLEEIQLATDSYQLPTSYNSFSRLSTQICDQVSRVSRSARS